jgi:hypothetical protein
MDTQRLQNIEKHYKNVNKKDKGKDKEPPTQD